MPNAINPNDYNIEYFSSGFLGVTTVEDFREYLFGRNLAELPEELAENGYGPIYAQRGVEKSINYGPITNPGDLDEWLLEGNVPVNLNNIRDNVIFKDNEYGPSSYQAYNCPDAVPEETGFIQYPTASGGDDYKQILLNDQLGLGPGTAINFESELNTIAKERRKEEALNKLKLKAEDLAGKLNLDPIGLLSGQDLVLKDYEITARPSTIGKIFDFALDTAGFTIPTSPIPKGAFGSWGDDDGPTTYKDIMDSTAKGTKSLIFNSVARNKYGPILQDPSGKLANIFGAGQAPQPKKYTDNVDDEFVENVRANNEKPLLDKINQAVGKVIDNIAGNAGIGKADNDVSPYEFEKPSSTTDSIIKNSEYGFDDLPNNPKDTWDLVGPRYELKDRGAIGTSAPFNLTTELGFFSLNGGMFWGASQEGNNPFKRGLLKYTQDIVNNTTNDKTSKSRFIGVTNDDNNFDPNTRKHKNYSMGNTVSSDGTYCRSWSVRNPYRNVKDLIRHGVNQGQNSLTRPDYNLSVLDTNGFVKVAPYVTDVSGGVDKNDKTVKLNLGNPAIQKYMLSIENLAWQNTEHALKLPPCEIGPNGGRLMWFPPYDINFTDNSSVNWDSTVFLGRGEPIYTYNNTERTGTLSFKVVVDHSMAVAEIKKKGEQALFRYFAGCEDPIEEARAILPISEIEEIKVEDKIKEESEGEIKQVIQEPTAAPNPPIPLPFFFRHAYYFEKDTVGTNLTTELTGPVSEVPPNYPSGTNIVWPNGYLRSAVPTVPPIISVDGEDVYNPAFSGDTQSGDTQAKLDSRNQMSLDRLDEIVELLLTPQGKRFKIKIIGTTSESGGEADNLKLSKVRAKSTEAYILKKLKEAEAGKDPIRAENLGSEQTFPTETDWEGSDLRWDTIGIGEKDAKSIIEYDSTNNPNLNEENVLGFGPASALSPEAQKDRGSIVELVYNSEIDDLILGNTQKPQQQNSQGTINNSDTSTNETKREITKQEVLVKRLAERGKQYMAWECSYFEKIEQDDPFIYETLTEKLKYFHPAFHSMTPEGFNSRLTFLKQCTRQGPNIAKGEPSNLAFGKPPICVLRVGDFYHTKIVIDTVNLTFDPLQWDLNPEGIGVQPMVCSVDLNFKFIGGSSLGGPISQLQNAVGFNFFANTGLYNPRTIYKSVKEYETTRPDPKTGEEKEIIVKTPAENAGEPFGYGAYVIPGQAINNATGAIENEPVQTPPPTKSKSTSTKQQSETIDNSKLAQQDADLQKQIDKEFQKKVDERTGAFKVGVNLVTNSSLKTIGMDTSEIDLGQALYNGADRGEIKPILIILQSNQESLESFEVTYPNGTVKEYKRSRWLTSSHPKGLQGEQSKNEQITLWDPVDRTKSFFGSAYNGERFFQSIEPGTYKFRGIATVKGNIEEDATEAEKKIYSSTTEVKILVCTKASDGNAVSLSDIPENGLC